MGAPHSHHQLEESPGLANTSLLGSSSIAQSLPDLGRLLTILCLDLPISKMGLLVPLFLMEGCCRRLNESYTYMCKCLEQGLFHIKCSEGVTLIIMLMIIVIN